MSTLPKFNLGPLSVGKQGFGCMGMSAFYASAKTTTEEDAKAVIHEAVAAGVKDDLLLVNLKFILISLFAQG